MHTAGCGEPVHHPVLQPGVYPERARRYPDSIALAAISKAALLRHDIRRGS